MPILYIGWVRLIVELGQLVIALVISGMVANLVGPTYLAVALLVLATCVVLLYDASRQQSRITEVPVSTLELTHMIGTSIALGLIWPSIPLILTWKRVRSDDAAA